METSFLKRFFSAAAIVVVTILGVSAQSSSVFDANYFDLEEGKQPPLRVGKGFDITDTYRQTKFCFTQESSNPGQLTRQENSQKTLITLHYTKTESEYQTLRSHGKSGKVSFLNLFSLGGSTLEKYGYTESKEAERLVFMAKVDFGKFEFGADPVLTPEAKALVDQKDFSQFMTLYGTHYLNGVRKEASVLVILKRKSTTTTNSNQTGNSVEGTLPITLKTTVSFEVANESTVNNSLSKEEFEVDIVVDGPSLSEADLEESIADVLIGDDADKVAAIRSIISRSLSSISDPEQGRISQYYFAPFTLYGVPGIVWDTKKEAQLVALNQLVVQAYKTKTKVEAFAKADYLATNLNAVKGIERLDGGASWVEKYKTTYNSLKPKLLKHLTDLNNGLSELEKVYVGCSQIGCDVTPTCCNFGGLDTRIATSAGNAEKDVAQIEAVEMEAYRLAMNAKEEAERPECEKEQYGIVSIVNYSTNPYRIYLQGELHQTIPGKETLRLALSIGQWQIKAEQVSGYVFYATVNHRTATVQAACQEIQLKVGFED